MGTLGPNGGYHMLHATQCTYIRVRYQPPADETVYFISSDPNVSLALPTHRTRHEAQAPDK
jgi:hypothetical protein